MVEIRKLCKTFAGAKEVEALRDVNLSVQDGEIFGIMGKSGAGKSTLLRCISLLEKPTRGTISIGGMELSSLRGKALISMRRTVGVIFQGYNLLMQRTVGDNVAFPLELDKTPKKERTERVRQLLRLVDLEDKEDVYPSQLSGGQKQRVAIARALASRPLLLLCDEPTSALDSLTTSSILRLLRDINRELGVTIIIITHEVGVVRAICHRIAVLHEGEIIEEGTTDEIISNPRHPTTKLLLGQLEVL